MDILGQLGCAIVMGISALGSAIGIMTSGQAAIGAWKRCYMANKPAPFILTVFAGAPLTQTIYGFLLMQTMMGAAADSALKFGIGLFSSIAICASAIAQGRAGASGSDALGETGKGF